MRSQPLPDDPLLILVQDPVHLSLRDVGGGAAAVHQDPEADLAAGQGVGFGAGGEH